MRGLRPDLGLRAGQRLLGSLWYSSHFTHTASLSGRSHYEKTGVLRIQIHRFLYAILNKDQHQPTCKFGEAVGPMNPNQRMNPSSSI